MTDARQRIASLSPEQKALLAKRLADRAAGPRESIAIVGMGCRMPGNANTPEAFWDLLVAGRDEVGPPPPSRAGLLKTEAGYLADVDRFDAAFFGISPDEAMLMDPQQRLFLEVVWEALERAGIDAGRLAGTATGVYVGIHSHSNDYQLLQLAQPGGADLYSSTGAAHSVVANRISYLLDLRGPSMAIDTACSSSLVAVHQACSSLRTGETDLAIAGGVNLILLEAATTAFGRLGILSPGARCRVFDAAADGIARGEGVGAIVLKRLSDAERDGDVVLAVIRGSGVNQDGASNGLTAPNGASQEQLLRRVWSDGGVAGGQLAFVETHGTGTALGDPIEVNALAAVIGAGRERSPIWLGAVKSNIGHLEAAAGIAAIIKSVLCLRHRKIPANRHFVSINPQIEIGEARLTVPIQLESLSADGRLLAAVSSFGFGGTNAHVLLESAPVSAPPPSTPGAVHVLPISARSPGAVRELGEAWIAALESADAELAGLAYTAAVGRVHSKFRVGAVGATAAEMQRDIRRQLEGGVERITDRRVLFVYSGQGTQWSGMGRELLEREPVFREAFQAVAEKFRTLAGFDLNELVDGRDGGRLVETSSAQPAIFAMQVALTALLKHWGIEAEGVVGHSVGEIAAAHAAGVLSLDDAVLVAHHRARLMADVSRGGAMIQVGLSESDLAGMIRQAGVNVDIAALNGPAISVAAGEREAVNALAERLQAAGIGVQRVPVEYAFHSHMVESIRQPLEAALRSIKTNPAVIPIFSTVTGQAVRATDYQAGYWADNVRGTVRFFPAVRAAVEDGFGLAVEISPHPALSAGIESTAASVERGMVTIPSLRRDRSSAIELRQLVVAAYRAGIDPAWRALTVPNAKVVPAPTYPWQRSRHWVDGPDAGALAAGILGAATVGSSSCYRLDWTEAESARATRLELHPGDVVAPPSDDSSARLDELERRSLDLIEQAFRELRLAEPGRVLTWADAEAVGVAARHRRLWERCCGILAEEGRLVRVEAGWRVESWSARPGQPLVDGPEGRLLEQCGTKLSGVLTGAVDPLDLLFPAAGSVSAESIYSEAGSARRLNGATARAVAQLTDRNRGRGLRVIEIGAGTGSTTAGVLPLLPPGSSYVATDLSPTLIEGLATRFGSTAGTEFRKLDIERDPREQGFHPGRADVVIAANVLHATRDLSVTLAHVRSLLAPGGLLMLVETTAARRWIDLTFGLTEGWWRYQDAHRLTSALLSPEEWARLLASSGFAPDVVTAGHEDRAPHAQALIVARREQGSPRDGKAWSVIVPNGSGAWIVGLEAAGHVVDRHLGSFDGWSDVIAKASRAHGSRWGGVIYDASALVDSPDGATSALSDLAGAAAALRDQQAGGRLFVVTSRAVGIDDERQSAAQATLWGLGRSIALEVPLVWGGLVDLDPSGSVESAGAAVLEMLEGTDDEDQVAWRGDRRLVPRLRNDNDPPAASLPIRADGSYLVSGAFGGLGPKLIGWLSRCGARRLILLGRSIPERAKWSAVDPDSTSGKAIAAVRVAEARGISCVTAAVDVTDHAAMAPIFAEARERGQPVRGVVHAAAAIQFAPIDELDRPTLTEALRAKADGVQVLDELTRAEPVDFLILFSSGTTILGARHLGAYAAANQYLTAVARERRRQGFAATVIHWGAWSEIRLLGVERKDEMSALGFETLGDEDAFEIMTGLVAAGTSDRFVAVLDVARLRAAYETARKRPMLAELRAAPSSSATPEVAPSHSDAEPTLASAVAGLSGDQARLRIEEFVAREVARVLGLGLTEVDPERGLFDLGVDSLMAVRLRNRLEVAVGGDPLPATMVFNYPTVVAIARLLSNRLGTDAVPVSREPIGSAETDPAADDEVRSQLLAELSSIDVGEAR